MTGTRFEHDSIRCCRGLETYRQNQGQVCSKRLAIQNLFSAPHSLSGVLETCQVYTSCCEPRAKRGARNVFQPIETEISTQCSKRVHHHNIVFSTPLSEWGAQNVCGLSPCFQHPCLYFGSHVLNLFCLMTSRLLHITELAKVFTRRST